MGATWGGSLESRTFVLKQQRPQVRMHAAPWPTLLNSMARWARWLLAASECGLDESAAPAPGGLRKAPQTSLRVCVSQCTGSVRSSC